MPTSKNRKTHKQKLNNFKNKTRQKMNEQQNAMNQQLPPVRSIPTWDNNAEIKITGYEWEALQNGITQMQGTMQAAQAIMSRHIINGTIGMEFEKLDPKTLQYGEMTAEEKAPYIEDFKRAIEAIKNPPAPEPATKTSSIVTADGENVELPVTNAPEPVADNEPVAVPKEGKVVKMPKKGK